jgi:hypothetical protein
MRIVEFGWWTVDCGVVGRYDDDDDEEEGGNRLWSGS